MYAWICLFWMSFRTGTRKFFTSSGVQPKTLVSGPSEVASSPSIIPKPNHLPQSLRKGSLGQVFIGTLMLTFWMSTNPISANISFVRFGYRSDFPVRSVASIRYCCHLNSGDFWLSDPSSLKLSRSMSMYSNQPYPGLRWLKKMRVSHWELYLMMKAHVLTQMLFETGLASSRRSRSQREGEWDQRNLCPKSIDFRNHLSQTAHSRGSCQRPTR